MPDSFFDLAMKNAMSLYQQGSLQKAIEYVNKALHIAEKAGDTVNFLRALEFLLGLYLESFEDDLVLEAAETLIDTANSV